LKLKGYQRQYLRSKAHHLKPIIIIGKNNLSEGAFNSINEAFAAHELIKIKVIDNKKKKEYISKISEQIKCHIVGDIGKTMIFYKKNDNPDLIKIHLPIK